MSYDARTISTAQWCTSNAVERDGYSRLFLGSKGISRFGNISLSHTHVGDNVTSYLEPSNTFDGDCITLHSFFVVLLTFKAA